MPGINVTAALSFVVVDPVDEELTQLTQYAYRAVEPALAFANALPAQFVRLESGELIVLEARGQSSVTGHGKQGLRPSRIEFLRQVQAAGIPVLLVFFEGERSRREAWLHDLPPAQAISHGQDGAPSSKRYGWLVSEMDKRTDAFTLPSRVPAPRVRPQGALI